MNEGTDGRKDAFSGQLTKLVQVPVVGIPYALGSTLGAEAQAGGVSVHLAVDAVAGKRPSRNVVAETSGAAAGAWIMIGAHLDSVPEGPGTNDNGSGTAAGAEAALQPATQPAQAARSRKSKRACWAARQGGRLIRAISRPATRSKISTATSWSRTPGPSCVRSRRWRSRRESLTGARRHSATV